MQFLPVREHPNENLEFLVHPDCQDTIYSSIEFYKKVGFQVPWIGYYVAIKKELVGAAAFKGKPINGKVEIAYGTFPRFQKSGIGTAICKELVKLSLETDPSVKISARTLPEESYSVKILRKNGFEFQGIIMDEEDGEVWEWEYKKHFP